MGFFQDPKSNQMGVFSKYHSSQSLGMKDLLHNNKPHFITKMDLNRLYLVISP